MSPGAMSDSDERPDRCRSLGSWAVRAESVFPCIPSRAEIEPGFLCLGCCFAAAIKSLPAAQARVRTGDALKPLRRPRSIQRRTPFAISFQTQYRQCCVKKWRLAAVAPVTAAHAGLKPGRLLRDEKHPRDAGPEGPGFTGCGKTLRALSF